MPPGDSSIFQRVSKIKMRLTLKDTLDKMPNKRTHLSCLREAFFIRLLVAFTPLLNRSMNFLHPHTRARSESRRIYYVDDGI